MRICVFGTGGVGGYIGAQLCNRGHDVTLVARGAHLEAIKAHGLTVVEDTETSTVFPDAAVDEQGLSGNYDLILLCVKGYDMDHAVEALHTHVDADTIVLPLANGVDHFAKLSAGLNALVLTGCCYILSHIASPGTVRKEGKVFAAVFGSSAHPDAVSRIADLFAAAELRCKTPDDIDSAVWKKFLFISTFASLTSYYDMRIKKVYETHRDEAEALMLEIAAVARAKGIEIGDEVSKALHSAAGLPESASTSMHLDYLQGRATEVDALCGFVVVEGKRLGVETPVMGKLYERLKTGRYGEPTRLSEQTSAASGGQKG